MRDVNCGLLSDTSAVGVPKDAKIFFKSELAVFASAIQVNQENAPKTTRQLVLLSFVRNRGPRKSIYNYARGYDDTENAK